MAQNTPKRKIKDSVFTNLFQDKKYLLRLYKALHPEDLNLGSRVNPSTSRTTLS